MTARRVAAYLVCATVLAAWLASAAGIGEPAAPPPAVPSPVETSGTESLGQEVLKQTERLRARLASAPSPKSPTRNPFTFAPAVPPVRRAVAPPPPPPAALPTPAVFPEPALQLAGVAEDASPTGPVRTAIITGEGGEILMVKVGDLLGARYRVRAVSPDAVELNDLSTGAVRRLVLRQP